jgi:hypothetical protein
MVAATGMGDIYYGGFKYDGKTLISLPKLHKVIDGSVLGFQRPLDIKIIKRPHPKTRG